MNQFINWSELSDAYFLFLLGSNWNMTACWRSQQIEESNYAKQYSSRLGLILVVRIKYWENRDIIICNGYDYWINDWVFD